MRLLTTGVLLLLAHFGAVCVFGQSKISKPIVAGFYPYSKSDILMPEQISFEKLTHLIYCFAWPESDGKISTQSNTYHNTKLITMAHTKGCKVIVMIGGGGVHSDGFHQMASLKQRRKKFITNLILWCKAYGYDGVNIDWEYPGNNGKAEDRNNLSLLVQEMRIAFDAEKLRLNKHLEISIDVHSMLYHAQWIDYPFLSQYMDWFGLMTYDYSGDWPSSEHASHNAPLFCGDVTICDRYLCVDRAFHNLKDSLSINSSQIVIGVPFYGRTFQNESLYETPKRGGDGIAYYDITTLIGNGWTRYWDEQSKVPFLLKDNGVGFVSYDDSASIQLKIDYVKSNDIRGVMIWEITQDVDRKSKDQPLLNSISERMRKKR